MKRVLLCLLICMMTNDGFTAATATKQTTSTRATTVETNPENKEKFEVFSLQNVTGTFDITSDYRDRGISQTQNLPAVQGGLTYLFPIGLYFNVWGSNVKLFDFRAHEATIELDTIAGWRGSFWNNNISYDINIDRYSYPQSPDGNYNELNTLWTYKILQLGFSYSANAYNTHQTGLYYNGTITLPIPPRYVLQLQDLNFQLEMGHYSLPRAAGNSYNDYSATLNKKLNSVYTLTVQWVNTDGRQHLSPYDSAEILGMITASF